MYITHRVIVRIGTPNLRSTPSRIDRFLVNTLLNVGSKKFILSRPSKPYSSDQALREFVASYGSEFLQAIYQHFGDRAYSDVDSATDFAVAQGWADPNRLAIFGWRTRHSHSVCASVVYRSLVFLVFRPRLLRRQRNSLQPGPRRGYTAAIRNPNMEIPAGGNLTSYPRQIAQFHSVCHG